MKIDRIGKDSILYEGLTGCTIDPPSLNSSSIYDNLLVEYSDDTDSADMKRSVVVGSLRDWISEGRDYAWSQVERDSLPSEDYAVAIFMMKSGQDRDGELPVHSQVAHNFGRKTFRSEVPLLDEHCLALFELTSRSVEGIRRVDTQSGRLGDGCFIEAEDYESYCQADPFFSLMIEEVPGTLYVVE